MSGDSRTLAEFFDDHVGCEEDRDYADRVLRDVRTLQRALAYYADPDHYDEDSWGVRAVIGEYGNAGRTARRTSSALRRLLGPSRAAVGGGTPK